MSITVTTHRHQHVAEIRFARPPLNFACPELLAQIADALDAIDADPLMRCSVLAADGKAFCAGADLAGDSALTSGTTMDVVSDLYAQAKRIFARAKPMVAAVHGAAIGAGLGLALAADFRVAGPGTRFAANFTALGFHPGFGITHTLPRLIGPQRAGWMMLSSERIKPQVALDWGLVDRLAEPDMVVSEAHFMAGEIAANGPLAVLAVRQTWLAGLAEDVSKAMAHERAQQSELRATADYAEGVAAVFERRPATFTGK
jgi:enoyl-CoA hydratase/carnithine racemase